MVLTGVLEPEDQRNLTLELAEKVDGMIAVRGWRRGREVGLVVRAQGARMDVCCKVADCGGYAGVQLLCDGENSGAGGCMMTRQVSTAENK